MNMNNQLPYITIIEHNGNIYYGIIKIKSKQYITLYCLNDMSNEVISTILEHAKQWWWQSNRSIPISLFMREEMEDFEEFTRRWNTDSVKHISGPMISLSDLPIKRIKRRNVTLKKKKNTPPKH